MTWDYWCFLTERQIFALLSLSAPWPHTKALEDTPQPNTQDIYHNQEQIMDPVSAAATLATIIQLIGLYKSEKVEGETQNLEDFKSYLERHHQQQILDAIAQNHNLADEMNKVLRSEHKSILQAINTGNELMADFIAQTEVLKPLAQALGSAPSLSPQAVDLLKKFEESGKVELFIHTQANYLVQFWNGIGVGVDPNQVYKILDPRFFLDDVVQLEKFGLITLKSKEKNKLKYTLSRLGIQFLQNTNLD